MRDPFVGVMLVLRDGGIVETRFDRQQTDRRRTQRIVQQLGGTHLRASRRRRQQALPEIGEKNRVDQLGLAARELGDERDDQLALVKPFDQLRNLEIDLQIDQLLLLQPFVEARNSDGKAPPPVAVGFEAGGKLARSDHAGKGVIVSGALSRRFRLYSVPWL